MSQKFLDLAGLTVYDRKIKEWFKAGTVDITDDAIRELFNAPPQVTGPADNEIWYTSVDGNIVSPFKTDVFGVNLVSNTYEDGKGIITFDGPVTSIGDYAFRWCSSLTSITIPNSVTSIGESSFINCSSLTAITIPNSTKSIGRDAFYSCSSLTSIIIPNSVVEIGDGVFIFCSILTSVIFEGTISEWNAVEKGINWYGFYDEDSREYYNIPATYVQCSDGQVAI